MERFPILNSQLLQNPCGQGGVWTPAVGCSQCRNHRALPDVVSTSLIAEQIPVSANARDVACAVAADSAGTGAGDQHDRGAVSRRFEREVEVGANVHRYARELFGKQALHLQFGVRLRCAREAGANQADILQAQARIMHGISPRLTDHPQCATKTHAHRVRGTAAAASAQFASLVHQYAFCLGAAAVKAENETHTQSIREAGPFRVAATAGWLLEIRNLL